MPRPIELTIYPQALVHNYQRAKALAPHCFTWAVLKANAYGHGLEVVGSVLREIADGFAVLEVDEAVRLRRLGCLQPILLLEGFFSADEILIAQQFNLEFVVSSISQLEMLEATLPQLPTSTTLRVTLKIKSEMNRLGFPVDVAGKAWTRLSNLSGVLPCRWMVHFANADADVNVAKKEAESMLLRLKLLIEKYPAPLCAANSAAIIQLPQAHADEVRGGIMLYGSSPLSSYDRKNLGLLPTQSLKSKIIALQNLNEGDAVGYGGRFIATKPMRIAVVACGYADGYPRHAQDNTPVSVLGTICPLVGRVSMDMLTVDVSSIPQVRIGDEVELWGETINVDYVATSAQTISYELFCAISPRVQRRIAL